MYVSRWQSDSDSLQVLTVWSFLTALILIICIGRALWDRGTVPNWLSIATVVLGIILVGRLGYFRSRTELQLRRVPTIADRLHRSALTSAEGAIFDMPF